MKSSAFNPGSSRALGRRFKLPLGAFTTFAVFWTVVPAHAVTYTFQDIIDPANLTFTQALNDAPGLSLILASTDWANLCSALT
jgi:hypothetical protein